MQSLQKKVSNLRTNKKNQKESSVNNAALASTNVLVATLKEELVNIEKAISVQVSEARNAGVLSQEDSLKLNVNLFDRNKDLNLDDDPIRNEDITRAILKVGQIRRIEDVRLNRDRNLLIVSDEYDYNTDLRPFLLKIKILSSSFFISIYRHFIFLFCCK